jgi:hypothetical protein
MVCRNVSCVGAAARGYRNREDICKPILFSFIGLRLHLAPYMPSRLA